MVSSVTFSPDGRQVLTGSWDKTAILWDAATGQSIRSFQEHAAEVKSVAFSPDGRQVLTGSSDSTAILWDAATGQQLRAFHGHTDQVVSVAFSPDGRQVLTGSWDGTAILWDAATGQKIRTLRGHTDRVNSAAFSPDSRQVLTGSSDHRAILWDASSGQQLRSLQGQSGWVTSVAFSSDGHQMLTGSWDGTAIMWDGATGQQMKRFRGHTSWLWSVAFSPDGRQVLTGSGDNSAILWEVATGQQIRCFLANIGSVNSVAFSPDGHQVLTGTSDKTAVLWDLVAGMRQRRLLGHTKDVLSVAFSPDGHQVLTGSWDFTAILWDLATGQRLCAFRSPSGWVVSVAFSPDGRQVLAGSGDNSPVLWDAATGQWLRTFQERHSDFVYSVAFSPDGRQVLANSGDHSPILWDTATGQQLLTFRGHSKGVKSVAFSPDGRRVLTGSLDDTAILWDAATGQKLLAFLGHSSTVNSVAFSPDGRQALTGSSDGRSILWDAATGQQIRSFHILSITSVAFSSDSRQILTGSTDGTTRLWDIATGEELARLISLDEGRDWLVVTPEGLFDGSAGGRQKVMYRIGGQNVVPVDRFFQDFYRPGLLAEVHRGERPLPEVKLSQSLPPRLKIVTPEGGDVATAEVAIEVEAADQGGGVANLAIYQNGSRVLAPGQSRAEGKILHRSFTVALVEGRNHLRITASTADGSWEAEPAELVLTYERPLAKSRLYLVAVGVNRYADANLNLNYAARDARAFAELFQQRGRVLYEQVHVATLLDDQATKAGIREALKKVASQTHPQDTLVLFLAGHGTMVGQRYYFVPHELRRQASLLEDDIRHQAIPADELSDDMGTAKALKRMLIFDTCASGGALAVAMKGRSGFALRGAIERLSRTQGIFTIAASSASEEAQEAKQLGHGVLSYALLAGLKAVEGGPLEGQSVRPSNPEGVVDVLEWFSFAAGQVPRLTEKLYGAAQDVQTSAQGASFPVLPLEGR